MNLYVDLMNNTIEYIEEHIHQKLSLEDVARHSCVSKFHFNRMFKTVLGITLKQYILGRKLTEAMRSLTETKLSVIDAAYDFGFEYPEVFSRAFKRYFGVSPMECKYEKIDVPGIEKAKVVERDIINFKGVLTLNGTGLYLDELSLKGIYLEVDVNSEEFKPLMQSASRTFLEESKAYRGLDHEKLYTVVNCHEKDNGEYTVFYGMEGEIEEKKTGFKTRIVPEGWYVSFAYSGDMFDIRETFTDDLYRWIMIKEIELSPNGVGMINIFEKDYLETNLVKILVPVKAML